MTTTLQRNEDNKKKIGAVAAGVAGAVAIAGVAVAATMVLENEKTREKVKKMLVKARNRAIDYVDTFKTESVAQKGTNAIKKIVNDTKKVLKKKI